jgi:two-component system sensor histidine kinase UhpB
VTDLWHRAGRRLLRLPLLTKILLANVAIVTLGATAGTYLTTLHVKQSPHDTHYEMMALFAAGGLLLSLLVNWIVLRTALLPLARLERTARRVTAGDLDARVALGAIGDPDTDQLARAFNTMLDALQERTREVEAYAARLQELSDQVLLAQEEERRRVARELHDDTGQALSTLLLHLRLLRDALARPDTDVKALIEQTETLSALVRETLDGVRRLALELRPRMLDDMGLSAALRAYAEEWSARTGIALEWRAALPPELRVPRTAEIAVYRMVQEALANVAKHAQASRAGVTLEVRDGHLVAEVQDNGRGLPAPGARAAPVAAGAAGGLAADHRERAAHGRGTAGRASGVVAAGLGAGLGLFSMQERIALAGGRFELDSAPGRGTTVRATIPLSPR